MILKEELYVYKQGVKKLFVKCNSKVMAENTIYNISMNKSNLCEIIRNRLLKLKLR